MSGLTGWWHHKSKPLKVELYTRWSFHFFTLVEIAGVGLAAVGAKAGPTAGWLILLVGAHAGLCGVLQSRALDWRLGLREQPVRLMLAVTALSTASLLLVVALRAGGLIRENVPSAYLLIGFAGFGLGAAALAMRKAAHMTYAVLGTTMATATVSLLLGLPGNKALGNAVGVLVTSTILVFTYVFSAWLLNAVWDLDKARALQSRLAVAEERLRFGRDLHDVMGRNLAVIALKSELAVQLAERGRPEAMAQMTEVQRIARESQREVREVVRGYREADLHTELEGARGVLAAAGIYCRIEGDGGGGLSAGVQSVLGWVVREATTNVLRHGDAKRCTVRLTESVGREEAEGREVLLVIENDGLPAMRAESGRTESGRTESEVGAGVSAEAGTGRGDDVGTDVSAGAAEPARKGSGLVGLRERLAALGGTLDAGRTDGDRFRVTARVPLPAPGPGGSPAGEGVAA
ncbi:sensor histidine kinase [Streptomyces sp. NPDC088116]|uniref:sensor histidine kinase n=1 Tax=Streptomyces sp. NPDC088116 TaxID=3365825 RepID=UPI00381ABF1B